MKRAFFRIFATVVRGLVFQTLALAQYGMKVQSTQELGATIKLISVDADKPSGDVRFVKYTFEALKPCGRLSVYGRNYSKNEVLLSKVGLGPTLTNVKPGQKFQPRHLGI